MVTATAAVTRRDVLDRTVGRMLRARRFVARRVAVMATARGLGAVRGCESTLTNPDLTPTRTRESVAYPTTSASDAHARANSPIAIRRSAGAGRSADARRWSVGRGGRGGRAGRGAEAREGAAAVFRLLRLGPNAKLSCSLTPTSPLTRQARTR